MEEVGSQRAHCLQQVKQKNNNKKIHLSPYHCSDREYLIHMAGINFLSGFS